MKVNFNNVRRHAVNNMNALIRNLNEAIVTGDLGEKKISIPVFRVEDLINALCENIATIALAYKEDDPEFQDILGDGDMVEFNPE